MSGDSVFCIKKAIIPNLFKSMIDSNRLYRKKALMIPRPELIVLYNGTKDKKTIPHLQRKLELGGFCIE